jgi:hypothetical protein
VDFVIIDETFTFGPPPEERFEYPIYSVMPANASLHPMTLASSLTVSHLRDQTFLQIVTTTPEPPVVDGRPNQDPGS